MARDGEVIVDGRVDAEKLRELLSIGVEQTPLDFKATYDFATPKHKVECVKDLLAMMSLPDGGYIVVGVDDNGRPAFDYPELDARLYDSATLQQKIEKYITTRTSIHSAVHAVRTSEGARSIALIYAAPPPDRLPIIVSKDGVWEPVGGGKPTFSFRKGQIIVREGTTTAALAPHHWPMLLERYTEHVKAEAQRDVQSLVARVVDQLGQIERGAPAASVIDMDMSLETFAVAADALLEQKSTVRLEQFLITVPAQASADDDALRDVLDRVFILATSALLYGTVAQFDTVVRSLVGLYEAVPRVRDTPNLRTRTERASAQAWLHVLTRLYALGSLAVRQKKWPALRALVLHPYQESPTYGYASWLRHAVTMAARAGLLQRGDDSSDGVGSPVLSKSLKAAVNAPQLRPDVPGDINSPDYLLDSLCQFDVLWCMLAHSESNRQMAMDFYPSSSEMHQHRANPAFELVAGDVAARDALFPSLPEKDVASVMQYVFTAARRQSWNHGGWWDRLPPTAERWTMLLGVEGEEL